MSSSMISITLDPAADAAYMTLSDHRVVTNLITLLCELVPSLRGRPSVTQGQCGEARQARELMPA